MPIKDAVRIVGSLDIQWSENPTKEEIQADTDVEIDAISMVPENPEKEVQELNTILNLMVGALSNPALFQKLQTEGYTFNLHPIIEQLLIRLKIKDPEAFRLIRQEEGQGYASVSELRAAKQNVQSALQGAPPPSPPAPGQDHRGRLEIYTAVQALLNALGQQADMLTQLMQQQMAILQEEEQRKAPRVSGSKVNRQTTKVF